MRKNPTAHNSHIHKQMVFHTEKTLGHDDPGVDTVPPNVNIIPT